MRKIIHFSLKIPHSSKILMLFILKTFLKFWMIFEKILIFILKDIKILDDFLKKNF